MLTQDKNGCTFQTSFTPTSTTTKTELNNSTSITYGFLVEAKKSLYDLQDLINELQSLEAEITTQQYEIQGQLGQSLGQAIQDSYNQQAQGLKDEAVGTIIGGVAQSCMSIGEGVSMYRNSSQMSRLEDEQKNINSYKTTYENVELSDNPLSTRPETIGPKTAEEADLEQRIADHKQGIFEKPFEQEKAANKRAAELSSADEQKEVVAKAKEQLEANALKQQKVSASGQRISNLLQMSGQAINSLAQGSGKVAQASETAAQASSETIRAMSQQTMQMLSPSDSYKQMDSYQENAINVLQIIQSIENANRYEPAR